MKQENAPIIVWFRQDLRLSDNAALLHAVHSGKPVIALYILDEESADMRPLGGASKWWLHESLQAFGKALASKKVALILRAGAAQKILDDVIKASGADEVVWNRLYEPYASARDAKIKTVLKEAGIAVTSLNGSLLFEPWEIKNKSGGPYRVYTPFSKACFEHGVRAPVRAPAKIDGYKGKIPSLSLQDLALLPDIKWYKGMSKAWTPGEEGARKHLTSFVKTREAVDHYKDERDYPARNGTSRLSPHLHFGEISPHQVWHYVAMHGDETGVSVHPYLRQLLWREFSYHLLYHFPRMQTRALDEKFDKFPWKGKRAHLPLWQKGMTGYPIIDAGMRELWQTGWMHNRVRMIVGSFLVKNLLLPWQDGEAWFWDTLVDADLANNTASWQWVAGCGADAAPYFRIFNPVLQSGKFDQQALYIREYVPELANLPDGHIHEPWKAPDDILKKAGITLGETYPKPIVDLQSSRNRALEAYGVMKDGLD